MPGHPPWSLVGRPSGPRRPGPPFAPRPRAAVAPRNDVVAPVYQALVGTTIRIPVGFVARIQLVGVDANEAARPIEAQNAASGDEKIFTATVDPATGIVSLTAGEVGTATLKVEADSAPGAPIVIISDVLTVVVYRVATRIVTYYTVAGAREIVAQFDVVRVPINKTAIVRIEGQDDVGNVVPLESQVFDDAFAEKYSLAPTNPPDPNQRILTPLLVGSDPLPVTADGDPGPGTAPLFAALMISVADTLATHFRYVVAIDNTP